jgi:hypothetical protein
MFKNIFKNKKQSRNVTEKRKFTRVQTSLEGFLYSF